MTSATAQTPVEFLRSAFLERKQRNPAYSLRAFARDMGFSDTLICLVFSGKRSLTVRQAAQMGIMLGLPKAEAEIFTRAALLSSPVHARRKAGARNGRTVVRATLFREYEVERLKLVSHWFHLAILDLTDTRDFRDDPAWIAERLGISRVEADDAIARLIRVELLRRTPEGLRKTDKFFHLEAKRSDPAVRTYHRQMIARASAELDRTSDEDYSRRNLTGVTLSVREDRMPGARRMIQKFQRELTEYLADGGSAECDEVYQLNVQLFPLSQRKNR